MIITVRTCTRADRYEVSLSLQREPDDDDDHDRIMRACAKLVGATAREDVDITQTTAKFRYRDEARAKSFADDLRALAGIGEAE